MVALIRSIFDQALKTNEHLYFAVMTGCLRIAKESIFTGLNNTKVFSVTSVRFDEYFGFTDPEVREMLQYYGLKERYHLMKDWYDGYRFGNVEVYCPWDVINYCADLRADPNASPRAFWAGTNGNDIIRSFMQTAKPGTRRELELLVNGESVAKRVNQELTYRNLYSNTDSLWSVLFMTGGQVFQQQSQG